MPVPGVLTAVSVNFTNCLFAIGILATGIARVLLLTAVATGQRPTTSGAQISCLVSAKPVPIVIAAVGISITDNCRALSVFTFWRTISYATIIVTNTAVRFASPTIFANGSVTNIVTATVTAVPWATLAIFVAIAEVITTFSNNASTTT